MPMVSNSGRRRTTPSAPSTMRKRPSRGSAILPEVYFASAAMLPGLPGGLFLRVDHDHGNDQRAEEARPHCPESPPAFGPEHPQKIGREDDGDRTVEQPGAQQVDHEQP